MGELKTFPPMKVEHSVGVTNKLMHRKLKVVAVPHEQVVVPSSELRHFDSDNALSKRLPNEKIFFKY